MKTNKIKIIKSHPLFNIDVGEVYSLDRGHILVHLLLQGLGLEDIEGSFPAEIFVENGYAKYIAEESGKNAKTFKKHDMVKDKWGDERKVLAVYDDLVAVSHIVELQSLERWYTKKEMRDKFTKVN